MADLGENCQWLKGTLAGTNTTVYVNIDTCSYIYRENNNDYIVKFHGDVVNLHNCEVIGNLEEIEPNGE